MREILRLKHEGGATERAIARSLGIARSTVALTLERAAAAKLPWPLPATLTGRVLEAMLYASAGAAQGRRRKVEPDWTYVHRELRRPGATLMLVWEKYRASEPGGYRYSRWCELYRAWEGRLSPAMRQSHPAGGRMFVDYAGQTVELIDGRSGAIRQAQIFVAVMGASSYTYAEASWTQSLPDWIGSHVRALAFRAACQRSSCPITRGSASIAPIGMSPGSTGPILSWRRTTARPFCRRARASPRDKATASYCTSFGDLRGDGNEPGRARRFSAAALEDGLVGRQLPEATLQLVLVELRDQSLAAPLLDGGPEDAEACSDLAGGQHAEAAQPLIPAGQLIGGADEGDLLQVEGLLLPGPAAALVEDVCDLAIAVPVEEPVDLGDELGLELADLRNRQRT